MQNSSQYNSRVVNHERKLFITLQGQYAYCNDLFIDDLRQNTIFIFCKNTKKMKLNM